MSQPKFHKPSLPFASLAEMREGTDRVTGRRYYYGRSGHVRYIVTPIHNPEADGPTHVLVVSETAYSRQSADPALVARAYEAEQVA